MSFSYPFAIFIPVMFFLYIWYKRSSITQQIALTSDTNRLSNIEAHKKNQLRKATISILELLVIILLSLAASNPYKTRIINQEQYARNLMLVIDVSESMAAPDFELDSNQITRMQAIRYVLADFIAARKNDRMGLVVFGEKAYLQSPMTNDQEILVQLVNGLQAGMVGPATAIGDGLGVALKRLEPIQEGSKAIILLTDGVNNAGSVKPIQAAQIAKDLNIKIHTIGIGSDKPLRQSSLPGIFSNFFSSKAKSEFDEATLKEIAKVTEGVYFNAKDLEGLKAVYKQIDQLESTQDQQQSEVIQSNLYAEYAAYALCLLSILLLLAHTIFRIYP